MENFAKRGKPPLRPVAKPAPQEWVYKEHQLTSLHDAIRVACRRAQAFLDDTDGWLASQDGAVPRKS